MRFLEVGRLFHATVGHRQMPQSMEVKKTITRTKTRVTLVCRDNLLMAADWIAGHVFGDYFPPANVDRHDPRLMTLSLHLG